MNEEAYRMQRLQLEQKRNDILTEMCENVKEIHSVLFSTLGSAEMGKALENLGNSVFGITSSDFEGIEDKLNDVVGAIEEK